MTGQRSSRVVGARSGVLIAAGTVVGVLVLAGCGGGSSKTATTGSATPAVSPSVSAATNSAVGSGQPPDTAALAAYSACLQQHGVTLPSFSRGARPSGSFSRPPGGFSRPPGASGAPGDGGFGGGFGGVGGSADPSTAAARAACASLLPAGGFGGGRGAGISATTFAAFKSCMADKGVPITVTDPQQALRALDRTVAKTAAALKVCQPILGTGAAGGGAGAPAPSAATSS